MFKDRADAGRQLAKKLDYLRGKNVIVLAIPRGGVIIGYEIAHYLNSPLDVIVSRKLGYPSDPEYGIGAISENRSIFLDEKSIEYLSLTKNQIHLIEREEKKELTRRIAVYRNGKSLPKLNGKIVILADDGVATGGSAQAAIMAIKKDKPRKIIFAVPVCSSEATEMIRNKVDSFFYILSVINLRAIGLCYENFQQVTDDEVLDILRRKAKHSL